MQGVGGAHVEAAEHRVSHHAAPMRVDFDRQQGRLNNALAFTRDPHLSPMARLPLHGKAQLYPGMDACIRMPASVSVHSPAPPA